MVSESVDEVPESWTYRPTKSPTYIPSSLAQLDDGVDHPSLADASQELRTSNGWWREEKSEPFLDPLYLIPGALIFVMVTCIWLRIVVLRRQSRARKSLTTLYDGGLLNHESFVPRRRVAFTNMPAPKVDVKTLKSYSSAYFETPVAVSDDPPAETLADASRTTSPAPADLSPVASPDAFASPVMVGKPPAFYSRTPTSSAEASVSKTCSFRLSLKSLKSLSPKLLSPQWTQEILGIFSPKQTDLPNAVASPSPMGPFSPMTFGELFSPSNEEESDCREAEEDGALVEEDGPMTATVIVPMPTPRTPLMASPPAAAFSFGRSFAHQNPAPSSPRLAKAEDVEDQRPAEAAARGKRDPSILIISKAPDAECSPSRSSLPERKLSLSEKATEYFTEWVTRRVNGKMVRQQEKVPVDLTKRSTRRHMANPITKIEEEL